MSPSTCWCAASAAPASTTSSSARRPSACMPWPRASRARRCAKCRCCASAASRSMSTRVLAACDAQHARSCSCARLTTPPAMPWTPAAIETLLVALVGQGAGRGRRGLHRILRRPVAHDGARALSESRRAAHLVQGLWPRRRARRLADRGIRHRRAARQGDPALFHSAAHHRGRARHAGAAAARHPARTGRAGARRARAAARRACNLQARAEDLAQRRQFPAGGFRGAGGGARRRARPRNC